MAIPLPEIVAAADRLAGSIVRTPLVPLRAPDAHDVFLKLENLQPIGSFKIRGSGNAVLMAGDRIADGILTASAGNMAQGAAWWARRAGVPCRVIVPEHAPEAKTRAMARLGAEAIKVPFDRWWRTLEDRGHPDAEGFFIHPVTDPDVMAGNGTVGLEIIDDLPDVATVLVPYGGGGLLAGIGSALKARRPRVRIVACEVATAAPLTAAITAGNPVDVDYTRSFVDGIGGKSVLEDMWDHVAPLIDDTVVLTLDEIAHGIRVLATHAHVVAEGAGAAAVAAALSGRAGPGPFACVVSGGNLDLDILAQILLGRTPAPA